MLKMLSDKMRTQMYRDHRQRLRYTQCREKSGANTVNTDSLRTVISRSRSEYNPNSSHEQFHFQFGKRNSPQQERSLSTKSIVINRSLDARHSKMIKVKLSASYGKKCALTTYPAVALSKYPILNLLETGIQFQRLLRPIIFMDLELKALRPVGRLLIQLYTEASPQVVLEFVRTTRNGNANNLSINRVFPSLWLEGELRLPSESHAHKKHEFDTRSLNHTNHGGILSYSIKNVNGIEDDRLCFSISFRPLPAANSKRVAFGRVVGGLNYLYELQDHSTKNGKPTRKMFIAKCGLFSKTIPSRRY